MRVSLRTQILLLLAGTVAGLTAILLGAVTTLANLETDRTVRRDVQETGGVLAQLIQERSASLTDKCLLLARQPRLLYLRGANGATIADSLGEWLPQMHADAALLTDQDGRIMGATDAQEKISANCAQEPGIARALDGKAWSGVVARHGRLALAVCVPVVDGASHVVLMTFTAYSEIDARLAGELRHALGSDIAFVYKGRVVGASLPLPSTIPTPQQTPALVSLQDRSYFVVYAPLPGKPIQPDMGFVTLRAYDTAMRPYRRFQRTLAFVLAGALVVALTFGLVVARGLTRPLDGIMQAANTLSRGEWPQHFDVRRRDEIGLLQTVFNDMTTSLRGHQERLLALIDTDPLTGLDNHRRFQERLAQETRRSALSGEALTLLLFDLDHFQEYNRHHGHVAGDEALKGIAGLLHRMLPDVAILARYGGEKFVALLPQHTLDQAEALAEQIREEGRDGKPEDASPKAEEEEIPNLQFTIIDTEHRTPSVYPLTGRTNTGRPLVDKHRASTDSREGHNRQSPVASRQSLTWSVGCVAFGAQTQQAEGMLLAAELAVARAKQLGRDRACRFDSVPGADQDADPYQLHRFLKDGSLATIQALAAAVDAKDPYTQGHSQRVAEYATDLARHVGASQAEQELVHMTGTLHDVGKIGVPDAILKKPGRLDDEERTVMETHPVLGEVIVRKAPQLAAALPGVRHHHERWDGKGYPDGLAGDAIPRVARFLAVADTFDAMTSDRPYRKGLPFETALAEISRGAGTQFEPELAHAFVELMQPAVEIRKAA